MTTNKEAKISQAGVQWNKFLFAREYWTYLCAIVVTSVVTWFALDLRFASWTRPWSYISDAVLPQSAIKTVIETGWYEVQPLLNAPHGQVMHDYKVADNLLFIYGRIGALFTSNPYLLVNFYFFTGFILASVTSLWFFRLLGINKILAVALSAVYAITPYHFARGEVHLILSSYWPLPLAFGVVYLIARGQPIWRWKNSEGRIVLWGAGSLVMTGLTLIILATANNYYAFFALLFIAFFGLARLIFSKKWKPFLAALSAGVVVFVVMVVNMLPDLLYSRANGQNFSAVQRIPFGVEVYSLRFTELLLPVPGHRISALATLRNFYMSAFMVTGEQPVLGALAAAGFLGLIVAAIGFVAFRSRGDVSQTAQTVRTLAALTFFAFLLGTVGGFSSIIGLFTSDLRGWNRISILIALFGLAALGFGIQWLSSFVRAKWNWLQTKFGTLVAIGLAAVLVLVGYFDQVTTSTAPDYAAINQAFDEDQAMVDQIEDLVGADASIIQLPYREFPESPGPVPDTEQLKPFMHSSSLKWTAGGIKGRPTSEWVSWLQALPASQLLASASYAGFSGILLDRAAINTPQQDLESRIQSVYGSPSFEAENGRFAFYNLKSSPNWTPTSELTVSEQSEMGYLTVNPVSATSLPAVNSSFQGLDLLKPYRPELLVDNSQKSAAEVIITFTAKNISGSTLFRVQLPDGLGIDIPTSKLDQEFSITVVVPPGRSSLYFEYVSGAKMPGRVGLEAPLQISDVKTVDLRLESLLTKVGK